MRYMPVYTIPFLIFFTPLLVHAQFSDVVSSLFNVLVGAGVLLAIIMIGYGGILYMGSDAVTQKTEARETIVSALIGLLIVLATTLILTIINPSILNFNIGLSNVSPAGTTITGGNGSPGGGSTTPVPGESGTKLDTFVIGNSAAAQLVGDQCKPGSAELTTIGCPTPSKAGYLPVGPSCPASQARYRIVCTLK